MQVENLKLIFGLKIRQLRQEKGLSFAALAEITGLSPSYINEIEKGKKYPKAEKIIALAMALGTDYDQLVSTRLSKKLAPIAELLDSDFLKDIPLEMFGLDMQKLLDVLIDAPDKLSALINTILEISRNYGMRTENLYFSMLRSYQEMYENYFADLELEAADFRQNTLSDKISIDDLLQALEQKFNYQIKMDGLSHQPELQSLRSVLIPSDKSILLLNKKLTNEQKRFALAREIYFAKNKIKLRPYTTSWIEVNSFDEVLNNFKAGYFACSLLLPEKELVAELKTFFSNETFDPAYFNGIMERYQATPEMFYHRLTNLLPSHFGIKELFFLRFQTSSQDHFQLTKELHLSGSYNPHASIRDIHYCRRWISLESIKKLKNFEPKQQIYSASQRSRYINNDNEFLILSTAFPQTTSDKLSSVSIGLLVNDKLKKKVSFWNDSAISLRMVHEYCESCPLTDCEERMAPNTNYQAQMKLDHMKTAIKLLTDS